MSSKARVFVSREIPERAIAMLREKFEVEVNPDDRVLTPSELRDHLKAANGLVCQLSDKINEELLTAAPQLKISSNVAVGFDNVDLAAASCHGVMITNTPEVLTDTTADFAFALLMAVARRVVEGDRFVRDGKFSEWRMDLMLGHDVHHATLGNLGLGRIGQGVARRAMGFSMRVLYNDEIRQPAEVEREIGVQFVSRETVLREADFVSLHVPLTPATRHYIGREQLALMKPSAILVNTSRGPVIDEQALVEALKSGKLGGAGLDVFEFEPKVNPDLLRMDNVVLAPHIASASHATRERMATLAAENCIAGLVGKIPANLVNRDVLARGASKSS
jgi:glyoxylate reductase